MDLRIESSRTLIAGANGAMGLATARIHREEKAGIHPFQNWPGALASALRVLDAVAEFLADIPAEHDRPVG